MQRWSIIGIILVLVAIAGCTSTAPEEGYTVMFECRGSMTAEIYAAAPEWLFVLNGNPETAISGRW